MRKINKDILVSILKIRTESTKSKEVVHFYKNAKLVYFLCKKTKKIDAHK